MDLMRIIREAGVGGYASIGFGLLGAVLGCFAVLALSAKNRSAFSLGIATLVIGIATAAAGMLGTVYIRYQVRSAVASVSSGLDMERILREGFREAQSSSWIGFFAALIPLALGGVAALLGSRLQAPRARIQGFAEPTVSSDESAGQSVVAGIFLCLTVFACGGAWAMAHSELPRVRYSFEITDFDAWALANALEEMKDLGVHQPQGCERLQKALEPYWGATDRREWPRKMRPISPELSAWRGMADACAERTLQVLEKEDFAWAQIALLESPLLQSDELRIRLLAWTPKKPIDEAPAAGGDLGNRDVLLRAIRAEQKAMRTCYERELVKAPTLGGKLVVDLVLSGTGKVLSVKETSEPPFPSARVTACVLERFKLIRITQFNGGEPVTVRFPLIFKAAE